MTVDFIEKQKICAINEFKQEQKVWCAQWRDFMYVIHIYKHIYVYYTLTNCTSKDFY